ncbi:MAG TPA: hypothetical protein VJM33_03470 [Microthrixaceae bacterium]|nr:hypothetical protein [Microthrixaceae bacterium]
MTLQFDSPHPEHVPVRDAATVMLVRDGVQGLEVCLLRRNLQSDFVGGAYVFPGGGVDDEDAAPDALALTTGPPDVEASRLTGVASGGLAFWVAAIRESFEEAGLLLACGAEGELVDLDGDPKVTARFAAHRHEVDTGRLGLAEMCRREGLRLATHGLHAFARWITPLGAPRRYDTRFFVALAPRHQTALHDDREVIAHLWVRPADALERHATGELPMIFPTVRSLEAIDRFSGARDVVEHAEMIGTVEAVLPTVREDASGLRIVLPGDEEYDAITSRRLG